MQADLFDEIKKTNSSSITYKQLGSWQDCFGKDIKKYAKKSYQDIKTLSLFSGAGGLDIGFKDAGFKIVEAIEIEKSFAETLIYNSKKKCIDPNTKIRCMDIKDFHPDFDSIDFIIGGPPCQTFSAAGARAMGVAGTKDARGNLFLEYVRLLETLKPKGFLFENVYRIIGANKGKDWLKIKEAFKKAGYNIFHRVLDTADYGVPQHRERLIIVGIREDISENNNFLFPYPTHGPDSKSGLPHYTSEKSLHGIKEPTERLDLGGRYGHLLREIPPGLNYSFFTEKMGHPNPIFSWRSKFSDFLYKADPNRPVRTIKAQGGQYTGPFHWNSRPFSIDELKRLQTFPDDYEIIGGRGAAIHQIGNSVPPQFARILALAVVDQIFHYKTSIPLDYLNENQELTFRKRKRKLTHHYQEIARKAINKISIPLEKNIIKNEKIKFDLSSYFDIQENENGSFIASSEANEEKWSISLTNNKDNKIKKPTFLIKIAPLDSWSLPTKEINLKSYSDCEYAYTAIWKCLDFLLNKNKLKADLIQLFGYYQYRPESFINLHTYEKNKLFNDEHIRKTIELICKGDITRKTYSTHELSKIIETNNDHVLSILKKLKSIGYEIRNSGTNLSFDKNTYLIPYNFPTLNSQSVQIRKSL